MMYTYNSESIAVAYKFLILCYFFSMIYLYFRNNKDASEFYSV